MLDSIFSLVMLIPYSPLSDKQAERSKYPQDTSFLSNQLLNTAWPKVVKGRTKLRDYALGHAIIDTDALFDIISDADIQRQIHYYHMRG